MGAQIKAREEAERVAREQAAAARAVAVEKATQRAFKGIMPRPWRRMFKREELRRAESAGAFDSSTGENGNSE